MCRPMKNFLKFKVSNTGYRAISDNSSSKLEATKDLPIVPMVSQLTFVPKPFKRLKCTLLHKQ